MSHNHLKCKPYLPDEIRSFHDPLRLNTYHHPPRQMRYTFAHFTEFRPHAIILGAEQPMQFEVAEKCVQDKVASHTVTRGDRRLTLVAAVEEPDHPVDGLVIIRQGKIAFEAYPNMSEFDRHIIMSVTKPITAACIAVLEAERLVDTRKSVDDYLPDLSDTVWEGTSIRNLLDMTSGVDALDETPGAMTDVNHPNYRYESSLGNLGDYASCQDTFHVVKSLKRCAPAGTVYQYASANTFVLGWIIEKVSQKTFADFFSEKIWTRIGTEKDAFVEITPHGASAVDGGMSCTLRDLARFGMMYTPSGKAAFGEVLSDTHILDIQKGGRSDVYERRQETPLSEQEDPPIFNSWQWDKVWEDGDFFKLGWGGQGLYVSPSKDAVIAFFGTLDKEGEKHDLMPIARELARTGALD